MSSANVGAVLRGEEMLYKKMKTQSNYSQESTIVVTRTVHKVSYCAGQSAKEFLLALSHVPPNAYVFDWGGGDSESGERPYIRFEVEEKK